jgi:hypothetical protein
MRPDFSKIDYKSAPKGEAPRAPDGHLPRQTMEKSE